MTDPGSLKYGLLLSSLKTTLAALASPSSLTYTRVFFLTAHPFSDLTPAISFAIEWPTKTTPWRTSLVAPLFLPDCGEYSAGR